MRIWYNGVDLGVIETYEFSGVPVYDDTQTDYLYTRYSITGRALINGQAQVLAGFRLANGQFFQNGPAMSYRLSLAENNPGADNVPPGGEYSNFPNGINSSSARPDGKEGNATPRPNPFKAYPGGLQTGPTPVIGGGGNQILNDPNEPGLAAPPSEHWFKLVPDPNAPAYTHQAVRQRLMTPRGQLLVFAGPAQGEALVQRILSSPGAGMRTDCKNGPIPKLFNVHQAFGDAQTLMADFSIETYVNEATDNGIAGTSAILSNRFAQTHQIGHDGYTTVVTAGICICRTDLLYYYANNPDVFRGQLFMPIPQGFEREIIEVKGRPDVTGVEYSYADRQTPAFFVSGKYVKAASISAVHRQAITTNQGVLEGALSAYERVLGIAANKHIAKGDQPLNRRKAAVVRPGEPLTPINPAPAPLHNAPPGP